VAALVDTNILVYRFDPRFPLKQERATELLRQGMVDRSIVLPYQSLVCADRGERSEQKTIVSAHAM
jgi:predicted nucleic acid-binding protein